MAISELNAAQNAPVMPHGTDRPTRDLYVKRIPEDVWRRARRNAVDSGMSFRDYIIALLTSSQPQPATTVEPHTVAVPETTSSLTRTDEQTT